MKTEFEEAEITYEGLCESSESQLNFAAGPEGLGVNVAGVDDGGYSVYLKYDKLGALDQVIIQVGAENPSAESVGKLIGEVSVDSGQLLITDPCYILKEIIGGGG